MIDADVDLADVLRGIDAMSGHARDERLFFAELRGPARAEQREHARSQEGPESGWPPLSPATVEKRQRRRRRGRPRRLLGKLTSALVIRVEQAGIEIRSRVPWAGAHQHGATVGHGANLPARPFLWWSERFVRDVADDFVGFVLRGWDR